MSARQRYAGLSRIERRSAAEYVRDVADGGRLDQDMLDVWADLIADGLTQTGQVAQFHLYCWELASRVYWLRRAARIVDGAR